MALIIEFFGPPGAGKTTFAKALAARLREGGVDVTLHLSSRPGEADSDGPFAANLSRIGRAVSEFVSTAVSGGRRRDGVTARFAPLFSPLGPLRKLRLRQYQTRLAAAWTRAEAMPGVVIFDQAYLQLIATLLAIGGKADSREAIEAIGATPPAGLALCLEAAPEELASRLRERLERVGAVGRWLEAGGGAWESYSRASQRLRDALAEQGRMTFTTRSSGGEGFAREVERVAQAVRPVLSQVERSCA